MNFIQVQGEHVNAQQSQNIHLNQNLYTNQKLSQLYLIIYPFMAGSVLYVAMYTRPGYGNVTIGMEILRLRQQGHRRNNMARNEIASALIETLIQSGSSDGDWDAANVVDALGELSRAIIKLGNNDAATPMGGMEALGKAILDASENIKNGLYELAEAIRDMKTEE